MEGGLLLDIVVGEGTTILKLLAGEDQASLVGGDALLVLDLGLHVVDGVGRLDLEGDGCSRQGLDEDRHPTAEMEDQVKGRLLLDVATGVLSHMLVVNKGRERLLVAQGMAIFELFAGEDETLLVGKDALFVLDLGLHVVDGVRGLNLEGEGLSNEGLNEDLHAGI